MTTINGLGNLPDPILPAPTDWQATERLGLNAPPAAARNRDLVPSILQQGGLGSCTANAVAYAIRAAMMVSGMPEPEIVSRLFLYYLARASHGVQDQDFGTYLRAVFKVAAKFGFCPEHVWPYTDDTAVGPDGKPPKFRRMPSHRAFRAAFDQHAPTEYRKIYEIGHERIDVIKRALAKRHLVVFGTDVSRDFQHNNLPQGPLDPPVGMEIAGGHAMCLAEYDGDEFGGPNSWGKNWGLNGWFRMSADYLAWEKTRDLWIVEYAPAYSVADIDPDNPPTAPALPGPGEP